ncbi:hypothetical protein OROHE_001482 [Orobanche hederae]
MRSLRKYPSGAQKRKQKRRMDALIKLQAGSLSKYFITKNKQEQCSQNENENEVDEDEKLADGAVNAKGSNDLDLPRDDSGVVKEQILLMNERENIIIEDASNKNTACNSKRSFRKYPSGAEKRKQKKRRDALIKLQAGSLSKSLSQNNKPEQFPSNENGE